MAATPVEDCSTVGIRVRGPRTIIIIARETYFSAADVDAVERPDKRGRIGTATSATV